MNYQKIKQKQRFTLRCVLFDCYCSTWNFSIYVMFDHVFCLFLSQSNIIEMCFVLKSHALSSPSRINRNNTNTLAKQSIYIRNHVASNASGHFMSSKSDAFHLCNHARFDSVTKLHEHTSQSMWMLIFFFSFVSNETHSNVAYNKYIIIFTKERYVCLSMCV